MKVQSKATVMQLCALVVCTSVPPVSGDDTFAAIELRESKAALEAATSRMAQLEAKIGTLRTSNEALTLALAEANIEGGHHRSEAELAVKTLEALGVDLLSGDQGVSGRLLQSTSNLRLANQENALLRSHLVQLLEVALAFVESPSLEEERGTKENLHAAVEKANRALERGFGRSGIVPNRGEGKLTKVVGLKPDLGLLIVDAGEQKGVREGAPLRIYRGDDVIATALVVEVRPQISGAILTGENINSNAVAIGDIARLNLVNSFKN